MKRSMNIQTKEVISIEDVGNMLDEIHKCFQAISKPHEDSGSVVWASQATLAKRYDTSRSTICRVLAEAVSAGKVKMIRPNNGVQKYHVAELDAYMVSISGNLNKQ